MTTPTNADYLNLLYLTGGMASATPQGWTVLTPLHLDPAVGLQAQAYVNAAGQIVITIVGPSSSPGLGSLGSLETVSAGASRTDAIIGAGDIPTDYNTALQGFYAQVISAAQERGLSIDSGNIFVAGNSLGGYGAQYLASLNGLGGVSYGGPGNWSLVTLDPRAENFISYVAAGDGIANASSDTGIYSSSSPFPVQYGPRWGQVAIIGDIAQQDHLRILVERAQLAAFNDFIDPNAHMTLGASQFFSAFAGWATLTANSHFIGQYGTLLGTPLPPPSSGDGPSEPSRIGEIINSFFTVRGFVDWIREQSSAAADAIEEYLNISPNELPLPLAWPEIGWDVFGNMVLRLGGEPIFIAPPGAQLALSQENPGAVDLTTSTGTLRLTFFPNDSTFVSIAEFDGFGAAAVLSSTSTTWFGSLGVQQAVADPAAWGIDPATWAQAWQGVDWNEAESFTLVQRSEAMYAAMVRQANGTQTNVYFGTGIAPAITDFTELSPEVVSRVLGNVVPGDSQSLTITWEQGAPTTAAQLSLLRHFRADGSFAELRPVRNPFGEELWDYTEYSPSGQVVSHEIGTTIRATGQHVIVSWERDVDEDGEPTGAWERDVEAYDPNAPDPDVMTGAQIGEIFGSQLGSLIAGDNPFAQVLAGSALATVLGQIGGALAEHFDGEAADWGTADSLSDDLDDIEIPEFSNFFEVLKGQASGAISGFLAAELGEAIGLDGFGGQLFTTLANRAIGHVLNTEVENILDWSWSGGQLDVFAAATSLVLCHPCRSTQPGALRQAPDPRGPSPFRRHRRDAQGPRGRGVPERRCGARAVGCGGSAGRPYPRICPPSTIRVCPVTHDAASLTRNTATLAISSGRPRRPQGIDLRTAL